MCTGSHIASLFCEKLAVRDDKCPVGAGEVDQFIVLLCEHTKKNVTCPWFNEIIIQINQIMQNDGQSKQAGLLSVILL
jgi:hypothetical protein